MSYPNQEQQAILSHLDGTLLVLAAASTGKTRIMADRLAARKVQQAPSTTGACHLTFRRGNPAPSPWPASSQPRAMGFCGLDTLGLLKSGCGVPPQAVLEASRLQVSPKFPPQVDDFPPHP